MKIAFINSIYKSGSTGKIVLHLANGKSDNDSCLVLYGRGDSSQDVESYKFGLDSETYLHALSTRLFGVTGHGSRRSTRRLISKLEEFKPDIVHIHEIHAYFLNYKLFFDYLKRINVPVVFTLHCQFNFTGRCGVSFECEKWKSGCGNCPHVRSYPKSLLFDFSKQMFSEKKRLFCSLNNAIVCSPSDWLLNQSKHSFLGKFEHRLVRNGIDTETFTFNSSSFIRSELRIPSDKKMVLTVAGDIFSDNKNGRCILDIAKDPRFQQCVFVLVGVKKRPKVTPQNVICIPSIADQRKLSDYYSASDLYLITSKSENYPTSCIEAACCGLPVVGFDVGGVKETIIDGAGEVVPFGDLEALSNAILKTLSQPIGREVLSKKACESFSKKRMVKEYYDIYYELVEKHNK